MYLTPRLQKIADLIPKNSIVADIGTDHGYIPVYCVLNNISPRAFAMDINRGPLKNAEDTVRENNVSGRVELRLSNGLEKLKKGEADVVVIAGMGGLLIRNILTEHSELLEDGLILILQPMLAPMELREFLYKSGIGIIEEHLAKEGEKIYNIIVARVGFKCEYTEEDIVIGKGTKETSPDIFEYYRAKEIGVREKILNGLNMAIHKDEIAISKVSRELEIWRKENEN